MSGSVTAQSLITQALKANGIGALGQSLNSADLAYGLTWANMLLAQWQRRRWLVWHLIDVATVANGSQFYQIGPSQSFNCARPDKIEYAYARLMTGALPVDYPLYIIDSREEYAEIGLKNLQTFPGAVFYDAAYPLGNLYFWPIPNAQFELHVLVKEQLQSFAALGDTFLMPPEYQEALVWSLAARLRPSYGLPPDQTITSAMQASLNVLRMANLQVPTLDMPDGLPGVGRGGAWWLGIGGGGGGDFILDGSSLAP